jgi:indolepyruvate ferredoxin oxidoreductase beta subunit
MSENVSIYCIGVGGFGIGALSNILAVGAQKAGLECLGSETHGLAQRGGTVVSTLFMGHNLSGSPLIIQGSADIVAALEPIEALRSMPMLKKGGVMVYNTARILPLGVRLREESYPALEDIHQELLRVTSKVVAVEASQKAKELGFAQAANVVLLGALLKQKVLPFGKSAMVEAIKEMTPPRFHEVNLKALESG